MTRISNKIAYAIKSPIIGTDYFPITNSVNAGVGMAVGATKSADFNGVREFVIAGLNPEIGGNLKFTEIEYNGVLTSPASVANALDPDYTVAQYEVLFFNINGDKYILKLQDVTIGDTSPNISDSDFIKILAFTQLGDGTPILKGYNVATGNHEFYAIKSTGLDISIVTGNVVIEKKAGSNLGNGIAVYKGLNSTTKIDEFYNLKSSTLNISKEVVSSAETGNILLEIPASSSVPNLYVNSSYIPSYNDWLVANKADNGGTAIVDYFYIGSGTLAKPYTNSIKYVLDAPLTAPAITANTAIENGFKGYMGTSIDRLNPEKIGNIITIQNNNIGYVYSGDFNYSGLNLVIEGLVTSTISGKLIDMDDNSFFSNSTSVDVTARITIQKGAELYVQGEGFFNSGNAVATTNYSIARTLFLEGEGQIVNDRNYVNGRYILNAGINSNNNDGAIAIYCFCDLLSFYNGIYNVGEKSRIELSCKIGSGLLTSPVDVNLKAFNQSGGEVRLFNCEVSISGSTPFRNYGLTFDSTTTDVTKIPITRIINSRFQGSQVNTFTRIGTKSNLTIKDCTSVFFGTTDKLFKNLNIGTTWDVEFTNNSFEQTTIDFADVDISGNNTRSSINFIGGAVIEVLRSFVSKNSAKLSLIPKYSAYLVERDVNAGSLIVGTEYKVKTAGTGTPLGTVGDYFVAANNGSAAIGGVATLIERCVMV